MGYNLPGMTASFDNTLTGRRKVPTPPRLTQEQRRAAYEKALKLRRDRAGYKDFLASRGKLALAVDHLRVDIESGLLILAGMKVYDLLTALPGIGRAKALALLSEAGIPEKNTVRACGPKQTERLFNILRRS